MAAVMWARSTSSGTAERCVGALMAKQHDAPNTITYTSHSWGSGDEGVEGQHARAGEAAELGCQQHPAPVVPVGQRSADDRDHEPGAQGDEAEQAHGQRRLRHRVHLHGHRDVGDPAAEGRRREPGEELQELRRRPQRRDIDGEITQAGHEQVNLPAHQPPVRGYSCGCPVRPGPGGRFWPGPLRFTRYG